MIKADHKKMYGYFFKWYINRMLKTDFSEINIDGKWESVANPALVIGNHISWWDGFWVYYLNQLFFKKRLFVMMLEEQLLKNSILRKIGAFSINPGARSVIESLKYANELMTNSDNLLVMFPQGEIQSSYNSSFLFEKGIEWTVLNTDAKIHFYVAFVDYFSNRKPKLFFYLKTIDEVAISSNKLSEEYTQFYTQCKLKQANRKE